MAVHVNLSDAADRAIDERVAQGARNTRSSIVEVAIDRFVNETLSLSPYFKKYSTYGRTMIKRKFKISHESYTLLMRIQENHGYSYQEIVRHAVGELTGVY